MSILEWFKSVVGAKPSSGGPAAHQTGRGQRARDERLLPKEPDPNRNYWEPKPRVMDRDEADRLFSASMRTRDMQMRTLACDAARLEELGLPVWKSEEQLASALGLSLSRLHYFACHRLDDQICHYVSFRIPKSSGGSRLIMAPKRELRALQRSLLEQLVEKLPMSEYAHGFQKGRSVATNAAPHVGKEIVIGMDLSDFFGSVTFARVRGFLVAMGYGYPVATSLALLMTEAPRQPVELDGQIHHTPVGRRYCVQGAPTSPAMCNALATRLDRRLAGLARSYGWRYTRYADDMSFSGDDDTAVGPLLSVTAEIVADEGFVLNDDKTRVMHSGRHQKVTGVTVNETLGLSRRERRKIRAMIHRLNQQRDAGELDPQEVEVLEGKLAWVEMLNPDQAAALRRDWD
jgi:RNA-directed DNA polymerase